MTCNKILRLPEVLERTGLSRSTIYARIKSGHLIPPIKLGPRAVGWLSSDIDEFISSLVTMSREVC
jgi:prophage regulatory protein